MSNEKIKLEKFLQQVEFVRPAHDPLQLKVKGQNLFIADAEDEFCAQLVEQIPNMYRYLNMVARGGIDPNIQEDIREYLRTFCANREEDFNQSLLSTFEEDK